MRKQRLRDSLKVTQLVIVAGHGLEACRLACALTITHSNLFHKPQGCKPSRTQGVKARTGKEQASSPAVLNAHQLLRASTVLCNHRLSPVPERFHWLQRKPQLSSPPHSLPIPAPVSGNHFLSLQPGLFGQFA